jgi:RND family efflux transporter MFP subunit
MTRRRKIWIGIAVLALAVAFGVFRAIGNKRAQEQAVQEQAASKVQAVVELAASDVVRARELTLSQGLPISGSLRAVNSAFVKARAAGELQGLTVREGDPVQAGQVIAKVEATEYLARVNQAQQQADAAKAQVEVAQRQYDNNKALVDQGFISKTALDTSFNNLTAAQSNYKASLAAVDMNRKTLDDTVLRAPISGIVSQRLAQPGERVAVDSKVIEIVDLSRLELEASLSAADSVSVRVGQDATLQVEGRDEKVPAKVVRINPSAQAGSRSVLAYLQIEQPAGLRQGLFAQGTLAIGEVKAIAVPLSTVRTDKPAPYVQVVENDQVVHKGVELGARGEADGQMMVAVKGIEPGAVVIKGSLGPLREGSQVKFTSTGVPPPQPSPKGAGSQAKVG